MIEIKPLGYDFDALKPIMGSETLFFHHDKHYAGYVTKTEALLSQEDKTKSLESIIVKVREQGDSSLFNQAAQVWNHEFFFAGLSVKPENREISKPLLTLIEDVFQSVNNLQAELVKAASGLFGSGWVWLVLHKDTLKIQTTFNAETPCGLMDVKPLWTLDVWEHAYYLDYQNRRADYATEVVQKAINWRLVSERLGL